MSNTPRARALTLGLLTATCLLLWSTSAFAGAGFRYVIKNQQSQSEKQPPTLVLEATDFIEGGSVKLESSTGGDKTIKLGKMKPGKQKSIKLKVPLGKHTYKATIEAKGLGGEEVTIPFEFDVVRVKELVIKIDRDKVDTGKGVIPLSTNQPVDKIEAEFFDQSGSSMGVKTYEMDGKSGAMEVTWEAGTELGGIELRVYDLAGFWSSVLLEPWWIEIEHEEIIFESGKSDVLPSEVPKLKKSLAEIREAMKKHAKHRPNMRLYVGGYTDTVGDKAANQKLSDARARSIARWFKKNGVGMEVYSQGFGEDALAVQTADDVPEEKNRRALYILSNSRPPTSASIPRSRWKHVR